MPLDDHLLNILTAALPAAAAGVRSPTRRFTTASELTTALEANDRAVTESLRPTLLEAVPGSQWTADEHGDGPMPNGDWWVVDPVGGNLNAIQGLPDWNIGVSLVRRGQVAAAALYLPATEEMLTAIAGSGARLNGEPIAVSAKTDLTLALTGTGQAKPSRDPAHAALRGTAIAAMLSQALSVEHSIPVGQHLVQVAAGRIDVHWQFENLRSHIAPVLIVQEAGGVVTDLHGRPWQITSDAYVAAAPGLHAAALKILQSVK